MSKNTQYQSLFGSSNKNGNGLGKLLDIILLIVTIAASIALICAYLAKNINPKDNWIFAFAGLSAPILYVANIIMFLLWTIRWRWYIVIPTMTLLMGIGHIGLFFKPPINKTYQTKQQGAVTTMTYNVMGFIYEQENGKKVSSFDSLSKFIRDYNPDILCLQEFQARSTSQKAKIDSALNLKYNRFRYKKTNKNGGGWGLAIYSNYPIIATDHMNFDNSTNSAMWADIVLKGDTIRVFNCHLQTTSVNESEREYISNQDFIYNPRDREEKVKGIASKLKRNYIIRAEQADSLAPVIHNSPYKVFVCGDFNDTPMSYVYHKIRGNLSDTFAEKGQGISSNTFRGLFNMFRIDYILHSQKIKALNYATPDSEYSDHKAVVGSFLMPEQ